MDKYEDFKFKHFLILSILVFLFESISGQNLSTMRLGDIKDGHDLMYIKHDGGIDSTASKLFINNAPKTPKLRKLPRFALIGNKGKYYMGVMGKVMGIGSYDFGGAINNSAYFIPSQITIPKNQYTQRLSQFNVQQSSLAFNFVGIDKFGRIFGAYVNSNYDASNNLNIQNAYINYAGWLVGYNATTFSDQSAIPNTIDAQGPCGMINNTNYLISYEFNIDKHWTVGASLELPFSDYTINTEYEVTSYQYIPDIPIHGKYSWYNNWVRLSAILRNFTYYDLVKDSNKNVSGWGINSSGSVSFGNFTSYFQFAYGEGIANYIQDMNGLGLDLYPNTAAPGKLSLNKAWGGYLAFQYNINQNITSTVSYSQDRIYNGGDYEAAGNYKYSQYIVGNIIMNLRSNVQLGVEYLWGKRTNENNQAGHSNRINGMLCFLF